MTYKALREIDVKLTQDGAWNRFVSQQPVFIDIEPPTSDFCGVELQEGSLIDWQEDVIRFYVSCEPFASYVYDVRIADSSQSLRERWEEQNAGRCDG